MHSQKPAGDAPSSGDTPSSDDAPSISHRRGSKEPGRKEPGSKVTGSKEPGSKEPGSKEPGSKEPGSKVTAAPKTAPTKTTSPNTAAPSTAAPNTAVTRKRRTTPGDDLESDDQKGGAGPGPAGSDAAPPTWPGRAPGWRGRRRNRDLYSRSAQRANEQWPVVARVLSGLLRRPDIVLGLLGATEPVEREGRVLNPRIQALLAVANRFGGAEAGSPDAELLNPFVVRRKLRRSARAVMPVRTDVYASGRVIPGPANAPPIGIRIYRQYGSGLGAGPGSRRGLPAIVFFHGGGWVSGDLDTHDALCRILTAASGCLVAAVDYRLAPEYPFPAAVDDALAAYVWVHEHSNELGVLPGHIGVMGDSAGGNLAAVVAQLTRAGTVRASAPPPVAQGLVYPVVDARLGFESMRALAEGFLLTRTAMEFYRDEYLADRSDWEHPMASPLLAGDLTGLAPALVVTAGFDPLRDDGANYAEALRRANVVVEHRRYDDQIHGFMILGIVADSLALATEVCEAMGRLMRRSAPMDDAPPGR
jgi:acetyl esterase